MRQREPMIDISTPYATIGIRGRWAIAGLVVVVVLALVVLLLGVVLDRSWLAPWR